MASMYELNKAKELFIILNRYFYLVILTVKHAVVTYFNKYFMHNLNSFLCLMYSDNVILVTTFIFICVYNVSLKFAEKANLFLIS